MNIYASIYIIYRLYIYRKRSLKRIYNVESVSKNSIRLELVVSMQVRKQQLELYMEEQAGPNWERRTSKLFFCHPAYLTYMHSTS